MRFAGNLIVNLFRGFTTEKKNQTFCDNHISLLINGKNYHQVEINDGLLTSFQNTNSLKIQEIVLENINDTLRGNKGYQFILQT